jgi:hypothetical protein
MSAKHAANAVSGQEGPPEAVSLGSLAGIPPVRGTRERSISVYIGKP